MKWLMGIVRNIGRKLVLRFVFGVSKEDSKKNWRMDG